MRVKRLCAGLAALFSLLVLSSSAYASHDVIEQLSIGPTGGNAATSAVTYRGNSSDGSRVFFTTNEKLVSTDTDSAIDIYERSGTTTTLISIGPNGGNGAFPATYGGISQDGTKVFFRTAEKLVSTDTDNAMDLYLRSAGATTLLSLGPNGGNGIQTVIFRANTPDGTRAFFETAEPLVTGAGGDSDTARDVYQWFGGAVTRISVGTPGGNDSDFDTAYEGSSTDGTRVFMSTDESLNGTDGDSTTDVYERFGSTTTQLSIGPAGGNGNVNCTCDALYDGASADGTKVWMDTDEALTADDMDTAYDIYERSGATTTRVSTGPNGGNGALDAFFDAGSPDGTRVYFDTIESLVGGPTGDLDPATDIYVRSGGTTTLASIGPNGGNGGQFVSWGGINSATGTDLFFTTSESLVTGDIDGFEDVYHREFISGTTTLVSTGPNGGNGLNPAFYAGVGGTALEQRVFFTTDERLITSADTDATNDIYERYSGATTLISRGHTPPDDETNPMFRGNSADGTKAFFDTIEPMLASDTDTIQDTYAATQGTPGGFPRPKGATPVRLALAPAYTPCTTPNRVHAPSLSYQSCNPPVQTSPRLTLGSPDANGQAALANNAYMAFRVTGAAGGVDDSDVVLFTTLNDVRNTSDLTDYAGQLQASVTLNITDKDPANTLPSTLAPVPLKWTIPCSPTVSTTVGSTCTLSTTADAQLPGMVPEGRRTIWEVGKADVYDGGPDNLASTADNDLFQTQALFVP